jgi:prepilin-type processing-associated H-X9-DG protein
LNISYFLNADAPITNNPSQTIFAGERDLALNRQSVKAGLLTVTTNVDLNWTGELHPKGGNLAFLDGHVEWSKIDTLKFFDSTPTACNESFLHSVNLFSSLTSREIFSPAPRFTVLLSAA